MAKALKTYIIEELRKELKSVDACLVLDTSSLKVNEERDLRSRLRKDKIKLRRLKNTLASKSFESGRLADVQRYLKGPSTIAYGPGGVLAVPRAVAEFSRKINKRIPIRGGLLEGELLDSAGVDAFARLPDRRTLNGMTVGAVSGTMRRLAGALNGLGGALCRAIQARITAAGGVPQE
jgi:large subunit ribosomal protein L10